MSMYYFAIAKNSGNNCQTLFNQLHGTKANGTNNAASPSYTITDESYLPNLANKTAFEQSDDFMNPLVMFLTI